MPKERRTEAPWLDHVSLTGQRPSFEELGFLVSATRGSQHHGRILLNHGYVEVTPSELAGREVGSRGWFLRPADIAATAHALRATDLTVEGPALYRGENGNWLDIVALDRRTAALPIMTRRVGSDGWPSSLDAPHPNGACHLSGLRLRLRDPKPIFRFFEAFGVTHVEQDMLLLPGDARIEVEASPTKPEGVVAVLMNRVDGTVIELPVHPRTE